MTTSCGLGGTASGSNPPIWEYSSQQLTQTELLPSDDGSGKPLAQPIAANTEAAIQMHYINVTDSNLVAHVELEAYALPASVTSYTPTYAYVTYNADLAIPAGAVAPTTPGSVWTASCPVPSGVKFWVMSTHSHKQSINTQVNDGSSMIFSSTNWSDPGYMMWQSTPFYTFANSELTWTCQYNNNAPGPYEPNGPSNANTTIYSGPSAATNEMCMAAGFYFPATGPTFGLQTGGHCYSETIPGA
jgi:hypothetical protein